MRNGPVNEADDMAATRPDLFEWGPPRRLPALLRLPAPICPNLGLRACLVIALGWLPLLLLVLIVPGQARGVDLESFLRDIAVHARFVLAAPLLVLAHVLCARRLGLLVHNFPLSGILKAKDAARLEGELKNARTLIESPWAEAIAVLLTYAALFATLGGTAVSREEASWVGVAGGMRSPAGWWHLLVSLPLLQLLLLGWLWRILIWTRLLHRIAKMDLHLIAAHPDNAAGLGFMAQSVRAFSIVGMALGCIAAGRFAHVHIANVATPFTDGLLIGGTVAFTLLICVGPLLVFMRPMAMAWRRGAIAYGTLASDLGRAFEETWFRRDKADRSELLSAPDFSAAADLYGVASNVYGMRFIPVDLRSLLILVIATLLPFIPAMFLSMPTTIVLQELKGLLF